MSPAHTGVASATPISLSKHGQQGWKRSSGYGFSRRIALEPLGVGEIPRVAQAIPVAFRYHNDRWQAVAVMGPVAGTNLFVDRGGQWRGGFVPGGLRVYPFCLGAETGELGLWPGYATSSPGDPEALPFFTGEELTPELKSVLGFLERRSKEIAQAGEVVSWLAARELLLPWRLPGIERPEDSGGITGLWRVDAERLHGLEDNPLLTLLRAGHLQWLYAHLSSLAHADTFRALARDLATAPGHNPQQTSHSDKAAGILSAITDDLGDAQW